MTYQLLASKLHTGNEIIHNPVITLDGDGTIIEIGSDARACAKEDSILTPTLFDIHFHGAGGHDLMQASPDGVAKIQGFLARNGVGHYLPTTVTAPIDDTLRSLEALAAAVEQVQHPDQAAAVGIHLEGPFLSHAKRGVHTESELQPPTVGLFERFQQAARGHIRLVTLAPEVPGALDLISYCKTAGVRTSIGHTDATGSEARAAIAAGAASATHTFNAMRTFDHREPGVVGTVFTNDKLYAELICDGIHVAPDAVRIFHRMKGLERAILVTDSISATGMGNGDYRLGNLNVTVVDGHCLLSGTQTLAGSVLTLVEAVRNYSAYTGESWENTVFLASRNPAKMLGLQQTICSIAAGQAGSFNRYDRNGRLLTTYICGKTMQG